MSTDSEKYETTIEREARHSAFEEFSRDERRPAVMLLSALLLSAVFFAIGIMVGRWTVEPPTPQPDIVSSTPTPSNPSPSPTQLASAPAASPSPETNNKQRRYALLVPELKSKEAARSLVESLERKGYKDVRTKPRALASDASLDVLIGRYTRDEAEAEAARLRDKGGPRMKNVRVIEDPAG
ncbi:MAG TPA: SPOR domain-containing protein [Pyrinomonadaceae bacterium]|jgi:cytoskeletal protein RodZ